jgi:hypothetical protein
MVKRLHCRSCGIRIIGPPSGHFCRESEKSSPVGALPQSPARRCPAGQHAHPGFAYCHPVGRKHRDPNRLRGIRAMKWSGELEGVGTFVSVLVFAVVLIVILANSC